MQTVTFGDFHDSDSDDDDDVQDWVAQLDKAASEFDPWRTYRSREERQATQDVENDEPDVPEAAMTFGQFAAKYGPAGGTSETLQPKHKPTASESSEPRRETVQMVRTPILPVIAGKAISSLHLHPVEQLRGIFY